MSRTPAAPPACRAVAPWLRYHLGRDALTGLTGQDARGLHAFVHLVELYSVSDESGRRCALDAMRAISRAVQPWVRQLLKRSIPHVMDWPDEDKLWAAIAGQQQELVFEESQ